ncbi:MAG: hypothetical protein ACE5FH_13215 [Candidatus Zixiibacteriota bacterium]
MKRTVQETSWALRIFACLAVFILTFATVVLVGSPVARAIVRNVITVTTLTVTGTQTNTGPVTFNGDGTIGDDSADTWDLLGTFDLLTGNGAYFKKFRIGTGSSPDISFGLDDLYVEGQVENDGLTRHDADVRLGASNTDTVTSYGTFTFDNTDTVSGGLVIPRKADCGTCDATTNDGELCVDTNGGTSSKPILQFCCGADGWKNGWDCGV